MLLVSIFLQIKEIEEVPFKGFECEMTKSRYTQAVGRFLSVFIGDYIITYVKMNMKIR